MEKLQALTIAHQVCEGTRHIHEAGYVHADLKTDNVLLMVDGTAKIADFGCAFEASQATDEWACVSLIAAPCLTVKIHHRSFSLRE